MIGLFTHVAATCGGGGDLLGFPKWYKYLDGVQVNNACTPQISSLTDVWLIVAAVIEILLRVAALLAIFYVIYGAVTYMISRGEPDKTTNARHTIINAVIGLAIAVISAAVVSFVAGSIH
ncbi:MAG: hypothetical protein JWM81_636 [Candidatus Saccharibacteria bacterium]|nr:hypothetical protein [Candidatus Saccharibacteria bacterium]